MITRLNLINTFTNTSPSLKNSIDYIFAGDPNSIFTCVLSTLDSFLGGGILMLEIIPPLNFFQNQDTTCKLTKFCCLRHLRGICILMTNSSGYH
jgi:hypothetical protein